MGRRKAPLAYSITVHFEALKAHPAMPQKYPVNKPLRMVTLIGLGLLAMFIIGTLLQVKDDVILPRTGIILIGYNGIFCLTYGAVVTKYAWTLNEDEFLEWYVAQLLFGFGEDAVRTQYHNHLLPELRLWPFRLGAPVLFMAGIAIIGFIGFMIFTGKM